MMVSRGNSCNSNRSCSWLFFIILAVLGVVIFGARHKIKQEIRSFAGIDKTEIEKIVQEYITQNPKVIINSVQEMQKREYDDMLKQAQLKIHDNQDALQGKNSEIVPFAGNKNGDVTIISFLDYRCGYCKRTNNDLKELVKKDPNVKIIFKELPVLGPQSLNLAKMAMAVYLIDSSKYVDFHNALMESKNTDDKTIEDILKKLNLSSSQVNSMMQDSRIQKEIESIVSLAEQLGVRGTPAFIIGDELIPGAMDLKVMQIRIKELRNNKNNAK